MSNKLVNLPVTKELKEEILSHLPDGEKKYHFYKRIFREWLDRKKDSNKKK